jgi:hypothetical protein
MAAHLRLRFNCIAWIILNFRDVILNGTAAIIWVFSFRNKG